MKPVTQADLVQHSLAAKARLIVEVLATYVRARLAMRGKADARDAVARLRSHAKRHPLEADPDREFVAAWRLSRAVIRTISPLPADSRCLFRSLTLLSMMERRAMDPVLVIGVRPTPFAAHAWVELNGDALLPDGDGTYQRLTEL